VTDHTAIFLSVPGLVFTGPIWVIGGFASGQYFPSALEKSLLPGVF